VGSKGTRDTQLLYIQAINSYEVMLSMGPNSNINHLEASSCQLIFPEDLNSYTSRRGSVMSCTF